jgi:uncharacterized protein YndB with AHSA1/START domain
MSDYKGETSIMIQAPIETVYVYLADFTKHAEWAKNIYKVTQTSAGPLGVGTTFKTQEGPPPVLLVQKLRLMLHFLLGLVGGAKPYSEAKITGLEPPHRIAWQAGIPKGSGFFNFAEWEFVLKAQGTATHLTQHFHWKPQTPIAERMVRAAGVEGLKQAVGVNLCELKHRLER